MRRLTAALLAAPLLVACAKKAEQVDTTTAPAAVAAPAAPADTKADADTIRALNARIATAMTSRDTAAIAGMYADDGVDFTPGSAPAHGRADLAKEYAGMFGSMKDLKLTMAAPDVTVAQSGDLAVSRAEYDMSGTDAKGKPVKEHGNVVVAWKKVNGAWKVATSINAPTPGT